MATTVDDRDPRITYTGTWTLGGNAPEYENTTHGTTIAGSSASFNFTGTSVSVFGTVGPVDYYHVDVGPPMSVYNLDHFPAVTFTAPALNSASYHYQFYTSPLLDEGVHYLVITSVNMSSVLWLDYLQYTPSSNSSSVSVASYGPKGTSSAIIIGATIGGTVFLVLFLLGAFWLRQRIKRKGSYRSHSSHASQGFFTRQRNDDLPPPTTRAHLTPFPFESSPQLGPRLLPQTPLHTNQQVVHLAPNSDDVSLSTDKTRDYSSSIAPSQRRFIQGGTMYRLHSDGGVRVEGGPLLRVDVPPDYQEYN